MGNNRLRKPIIILDTNMLLLLYEGKQVFDNIEESLATKPVYICLETVINELKEFVKEKTKLGHKARNILESIEKFCRKAKSKATTADKDIISIALELSSEDNIVIVATNDRKLRKKLREAGIPTAYYRESQDRVEVDYVPKL